MLFLSDIHTEMLVIRPYLYNVFNMDMFTRKGMKTML